MLSVTTTPTVSVLESSERNVLVVALPVVVAMVVVVVMAQVDPPRPGPTMAEGKGKRFWRESGD